MLASTAETIMSSANNCVSSKYDRVHALHFTLSPQFTAVILTQQFSQCVQDTVTGQIACMILKLIFGIITL